AIRKALAEAPPSRRPGRRLSRLLALAGEPGGIRTGDLPQGFLTPAGRALVADAIDRELIHSEERLATMKDGRTYVCRHLVAGPDRGDAASIDRLNPEGLRRLRTGAGLTQRALAGLLGIGHVTVSGWERGSIPIPPGRVRAIRRSCRGGTTEVSDRHVAPPLVNGTQDVLMG